MAFDTDSGTSVNLDVDVDQGDVAAAARQIANILAAVLEKEFREVGKNFARIMSNAAKGSGTSKIADGFEHLGDVLTEVRLDSDALDKDLLALIKRSQAFRNSLSAQGSDPELFSVFDRQVQKAVTLERELQNKRVEIAADPELRKTYAAQARQIIAVLEGEQVSVGRVLDRERSEFVVNTQREGAQRLAETRIAGQRLIQNERQTSRARIETFRFAARQIIFIERQISDAFKGAARLVTGGLRSIQAGAARLGQVFTRSNRDLNDGLRGALIQRESSIERSFSRQTRDIRSEVSRQSAIVNRFEAQTSKGVAGAISGRSSLGTLLGGGLAIGGGFSLFAAIRQQLKLGGDFVQGLAVLQAQLDLTDKQMAAVRQQSIDLGNDISLPGVSALDAAQAIQILAKQFANLGTGALPAAQGAARGVLQLSRAVGVGAEEAARVVGAAVNVFGVDADQAVAVADQITNALTKAAGVGFNDFADAFTQSAGVVKLFTGPAADATTTLAEFNAAIAVLAKNGLIGSDAGTSLKQFFLQANRSAPAATKVLNEVADRAGVLGSVFFDASGGARKLSDSLDILRKGTKGLTNQQLSATLQKLFGSDAARAAAFLINETSSSFDTLVTSILKQGSAAEIAAAQNVGFRGALDALKSVIETQQIKTYEKYQATLGRVTIKFANMLNLFFEGVGVLGVFRDALVGAGAALGTLLVAKGAAEAIEFLTLALRAALTPLGLLVVGSAVFGAALNVLAQRVPSVRQAVELLADSFKGGLQFVVEQAGIALSTLARVIGNFVAPLIVRLAVFINNNLERGLRALFGFIEGTAIPALKDFASLIQNDVIPPLVDLGERLVSEVTAGLITARDAAVSLFRTVQPFIQPAIDGFKGFGSAVKDAVTDGDFSGLLPSLSGLGTGIAQTLGNVGEAVVDALRPQLAKVGTFIRDFFKGTNNTSGGDSGKGVKAFLIGPFQEAVETIGFVLGNIVSDPRVVTAVAKIVGLAVFTGVSFVKGFIRGVISNIPQFVDIISGAIGDGLKVAFKKAFDPVVIGKVIIGGLAAISIGTALLRTFQRPVDAAGKKVGQGFVGALGGQIKGGLRRNDFAAAFFGGFEKFAVGEVQRTTAALAKEQSRAASTLRALGVRDGEGGIAGAFINVKGLKAARGDAVKELDAITQRFGAAAVAGGELRARLSESFGQIKQIFAGGLGSGSIGEGFRNALSGVGGLAKSLPALGRAIADNIRATGQSVGQALGGAIISGVGAVLAGQQLGTSGSKLGKGIGLAGIISSALFAGAAVGGGPQGAIVAGVTATVGLLSAAFAHNSEDATRAAQEVDAYASILERFNSVAAASGDLAKQFSKNLTETSRGAQTLFLRTGLKSTDVLNQFADGIFTADDNFNLLANNLGISTDLMRAYGISVDEAREALESDRAFPAQFGPKAQVFTDLQDQFKKSGIGAKEFFELFDELDNQFREVGEAARDVSFEKAINPAHDAIHDVNQELDTTVTTFSRANAQANAYVDTLLRGAGTSSGLEAAAAKQAAASNQVLLDITQVVDQLNNARTERIQGQISDVTQRLQEARDAAQQTFENILAIFAGPTDNPIQQALDDLLLQLPGFSDQLNDALSGGVDLTDQTVEGAQLRQLIEPFTRARQELLSAAIQAGDTSIAALSDQFQPLRDEIENFRLPKEITDPETGEVTITQVSLPQSVQDFLLAQIDDAINNPFLSAAIQQLTVEQAATDNLQTQLDALNAQLGVKVFFDEDQIRAEFQATFGKVLPGALPDQFKPPSVTTADQAERVGGGVTGLSRLEAEAIHGAQLAAATATAQAVTGAINRPTADTAERGGITIQQLNVVETTGPRQTASEVVRNLRVLAGGAKIDGPSTGRKGTSASSVLRVLAGRS